MSNAAGKGRGEGGDGVGERKARGGGRGREGEGKGGREGRPPPQSSTRVDVADQKTNGQSRMASALPAKSPLSVGLSARYTCGSQTID